MKLSCLLSILLMQLIICFSIETCVCQNSDFYKRYNFSFEKTGVADNPWNAEYEINGTSFFDGLDHTEGSYSMALTSRGMRIPFSSCIHQYLTLPTLSDKIEIRIDSKSKNICYSWLKVACLDEDERVISTDSVSIVSPENWRTSTLIVKSKNIQHLYLEIKVKSTPALEGFKKQNIDNLNVVQNNIQCGDSISIDSSVAFKLRHPIEIRKNNHLLDSVSDLEKYKIFALGESVHGSDECQRLVYEFTKYQIIKNKCRLVMFEMPFNLGLLVNNYLLGDCNIDIEEELMIYNCNIVRFMEFIDWIRSYNSLVKDRVFFMGIDYNTSLINKFYLESFFRNGNTKNDSLQLTCDLIIKNEFGAALELIEDYNTVKNLDERIRKLLVYELTKLISEENKSPQRLTNDRDFNMFKNSVFGINELLSDSSTAVIYTHLAHANKVNSYMGRISNPSFGNYMNKRFRNQYYVIALLLGNGEITSNDLYVRGYNYKLDAPIENSLEKMCDSVSNNDFYYKISNKIPSLTCRIIGLNYSTKQFFPNAAQSRFDALFFIKNSSGFKYPPNWPKTMDELLKIKRN